MIKTFIENLSQKLNVNPQDWITGEGQFQTIRVAEDGAFSSKIYTESNKDGIVYELNHNLYTLQFFFNKYKRVFRGEADPQLELSVIQVLNPGSGLGTKVMNHILESCRELNIPLKVVPAPIQSEEQLFFGGSIANNLRDWDITVRLRNYYKRLGFVTSKKTNAVMSYRPSLVKKVA